jgi:hypothetical protein
VAVAGLLIAAGANGAVAAAGSGFVDVAAAAGVDRPHHNRSFHNPYARIMEGYTALGAAVAVADYDGDGLDDLFVTDSSETGRNLLYHNDGDFTFTEVGEAAGVADGNDAANASADALWLDYDDDGREDLLVVRFGHSRLFRNLGAAGEAPGAVPGGVRFADVTAAAGLDRYLNSITAVAFDYDRDGDLDLLLGNYFQPVDLFDPDTPRFFPESFESAANGGGLTLYRNEGDGTFTDATAAAGLAGHSGWTLDLGHADADGDGDQDLYVASDFGTDRFFVNEGDGTFTDATERAIGIDTKKGMNADWGDFDDDGRLDLFVANAGAAPNLYRNRVPRAGHWLELVLEGSGANRAAVGASVRGRARAGGVERLRFVDGGNGFAGQSTRRLHFGLGEAAVVDRLEVRWPSGRRQVLEAVPADALYRLTEGDAPAAAPLSP